ncbi:MAG: UDP-glucose 4-epimerase GalE [Acidobacteriota bacterium]
MNVLVTGGAGYIGSVVVEECLRAGHQTAVIDNLVKGHRDMVAPDARFVEGDLNDAALLKKVFSEHKIEAVIHMAAYSLVGESVGEPAKYYANNVVAGLSLLNAMRDAGIKKLVFSSTAAVYGEPEKQPVVETDTLQPTNPYGETKLAFEHALKTYDAAYGLKYVTLRYFNAAGATERCGELHDPETHLIPLVLKAARGEMPAIQIFGDDYPTRDGTCVRDYIHVVDLARAHILALKDLDTKSATYNLGCGGNGYTVREVIDAATSVTGKEIPVKIGARRAGDPAVLVASSEKAQSELGWQPEFEDIKLIIESAWKWLENRDREIGREQGS